MAQSRRNETSSCFLFATRILPPDCIVFGLLESAIFFRINLTHRISFHETSILLFSVPAFSTAILSGKSGR
jgi:hypothetical protein